MKAILATAAACVCLTIAASAKETPAWRGYAANAQHTAQAPAAAQSLAHIHWSVAVDLSPARGAHQRASGGELLVHYASPMITAKNTVLVPVKTTATGKFEIDAVAATTGQGLWKQKTDYLLPPYDWVPPLPAHLTGQNRLYIAGAGGTVYFRNTPDAKWGKTGQLAFYGIAKYRKDKTVYDKNVMIDTPITADAQGNIYFGFVVLGSVPGGLKSGIARMDPSGKGLSISAAAAAGDPQITQVAMNCAPAISPDGSTIYITVSNGSIGFLVGLDSKTLKPKYRTQLIDPETDEYAEVSDDSSAAPTIGPDGEVYYGVLESTAGSHNCRGWLLNFSADLKTENAPGSFGWDDTVSIMPEANGSYYLMSKYNNYYDCGSGNGHNQLAILNPNATQLDKYSTVTVMKEVETILNPNQVPGEPVGAVYEWCVNSAVVDAKHNAVIANAEDGYSYVWDITKKAFSKVLMLSQPLFEAYTPTLIGPDGTIYAINNATLYAIGN